MHIARKLAVLILTVAATMAMGASSASALEVANEPANQHCGVAGVTCTIHANGSNVELGSPLGMIVCGNEFTGNVLTEGGAGVIIQKTLTNCTPFTVDPCAPGWPIDLRSETSIEAEFCVVVGGILTVNCHVNVDLNSTAGHSYVFRTGNPSVHRNCEQAGLSLQGTWNVEATNVEVKD
jgi:hypothetical protein